MTALDTIKAEIERINKTGFDVKDIGRKRD